jgi:CheY-like chemotaxis protein
MTSDRPETPLPRILLLEDDEDIRDLLSGLLASYGCEPVLTGSAEEVEAAFAAGPVALALLDVMLPATDGRKVARMIRADYPAVPVYYMTGVQHRLSEEDLAQAEGVLVKPFTIDELRDLLDATLTLGQDDPAGGLQRIGLELTTALATEQEALQRLEDSLDDEIDRLDATGNVDEERLQALRDLNGCHRQTRRRLGRLIERASRSVLETRRGR